MAILDLSPIIPLGIIVGVFMLVLIMSISGE